jgi:cellulose synthase/poly-beta-1,6-N-acetylglucosamine synthase-like glycosyltransferase
MTALITYTFCAVASVLAFFLVFPFLTTVADLFTKNNLENLLRGQRITKKYDYANIITAYRNVDIAKSLVVSLMNQTHEKHHIYLVADNADVSNWGISHEKLTVLKPEEALNLKAKSIIYATERFVREHEYSVIWDADNLAHPQFLENINKWANLGYRAIQGQRTAKNLNSKMAAADALGEFYKNYIERYLPPRLGSSTVISGSGMAVEQSLYHSYLYGKEIQQGQHLWKKMLQEDKILQNHIIRAGEQIVYEKEAICYDEKVSDASQVETQRSRWLFSYFQNLPNSTGFVLRGLLTGNWNKFFFGLVTVSPPLFILVALSGLVFLLGLFVNGHIAALMVLCGLIFVGNIFWTLYLSNAPKAVFESLLAIPLFVFKQFTALFKMANPNKNFKHSEHKVTVSIDEVLKE